MSNYFQVPFYFFSVFNFFRNIPYNYLFTIYNLLGDARSGFAEDAGQVHGRDIKMQTMVSRVFVAASCLFWLSAAVRPVLGEDAAEVNENARVVKFIGKTHCCPI